MSDAQILADDMQTNRTVMKARLGKIFPDWNVQLCDSAEDLLQQDLSNTKCLIIDDYFGVGKMTGMKQLIRNEYGYDMAIVLWSSDDIDDNLGADFIWPKTVSNETISEDLEVNLLLPFNSSTSVFVSCSLTHRTWFEWAESTARILMASD